MAFTKYEKHLRYKQRYPERVKACQKSWQAKHYLQRTYGLSNEQYSTILTSQRNCCAICNAILLTRKQQNLDHNHNTQNIRGILCVRCNVGLGFLENTLWVEQAKLYLKKHTKEILNGN